MHIDHDVKLCVQVTSALGTSEFGGVSNVPYVNTAHITMQPSVDAKSRLHG